MNIIIIGISILAISFLIYLIKNFEEINNKILKVLTIVIIIFIVVSILNKIILNLKEVKDNIDLYKADKENRKIFELHDEKLSKENEFYKKAMSENYKNQNPQNPYIPDRI